MHLFKLLRISIKVFAHRVWFWNAFFSIKIEYILSIKMPVTDAKTQKIEPDSIFFITVERFGGSV